MKGTRKTIGQDKQLTLLLLFGKAHRLHTDLALSLERKELINDKDELTEKGWHKAVQILAERLQVINWEGI